MATFLSLCQDVARESGTVSGTQPTAVNNQSGRLLKIVKHTDMAWAQIQRLKKSWLWMLRELDGVETNASNNAYRAASWGLTDVARWNSAVPFYCYKKSDGKAYEYPLQFIDWAEFRDRFKRGTHDESSPRCWAIRPNDNAVMLGPTPDDAYVITGEYYKTIQKLTADGDIPELPSDYHEIIMWKALLLLDEHDEAVAAASFAERNYRNLMRELQRDQLPRVRTQGPLA